MIVTALVGPSGTGKSYRAIMVAQQKGIDLIIDDGLLIAGNQIVTGFSAKQQPTRIAAIKTALFQDDCHRQTALGWIANHKPKSVLVLGTSPGMVNKIASRLEIPKPEKILNIEDIASPGEIKTALFQRNQFGNHVIPVPMAEVKQKVPIKLIRSLQVVFSPRPPVRSKPVWADQTLIRPNFTGIGSMYIAEPAITKMVELFMARNYPKFKIQHIDLDSGPSGIFLNLRLAVPYGQPIHTLLAEVQVQLSQALAEFTGITVASLNIEASGLVFSEKR